MEDVFGGSVDYAMLVKHYGADPEPEKRYSPAKCIGAERRAIQGRPSPPPTSSGRTSASALSVRRLTNAFSKKLENHVAALGLHFMAYNLRKVHGDAQDDARRGGRSSPPALAGESRTWWPWLIQESGN